jgi:hypothetical protein
MYKCHTLRRNLEVVFILIFHRMKMMKVAHSISRLSM